MQIKNTIGVIVAAFSLVLVGAWAFGENLTTNPRKTRQEIPQGAVPEPRPTQAKNTPAYHAIPMPATETAAKIFTIIGKNFFFSPEIIRVKKGEQVTIIFKDNEGFHDLAVEGYNVQTSRIQAGQDASVKFIADKTGTFTYYCSVRGHRENGMEGKLIVE